MKKLTLLLAASAVAGAAFAADSMVTPHVQFSSEGPDKYADGTTVLDGEAYALVWMDDGASFSGFTVAADGTIDVADAAKNKLVALAPIAKGGRCPPVFYWLEGENAALADSGSFGVYLLDTRIFAEDASGVLTGLATVGGVTADGRLAGYNTYSKVTDADVETPATAASGTVVASSADTSAVNSPRITGISVVGGQVIVQVAGTVPFLKYDVIAGDTPGDIKEEKHATVEAKSDSMTLIFEDDKAGDFFKVKAIQ